MFWSMWPGLAPFLLLSTFPRIPLDFIWILWPGSRREQNDFVFRIQGHNDAIRRLSLWRMKRRRRKTITPGLLISLWAPLAQSVSFQPSLQPSPPSQTRSSSVIPTRALSARVCYARRGRISQSAHYEGNRIVLHCYSKVSFYSGNPQRTLAQ